MIPHPCPSSDRWQALLHDAVPAAEQAVLTRHLEACPDCQRALEECAAHRDVWAGARALRSPTAGATALRGVMDRLKADPDADPEADVTIDFLDPSDRDGALGRINGYEVMAEIGRGGFGVVFQALDPALHRVVALKVLAPQLAVSASARRRFTREARAVAAVVHDHVVTVHAVEEFKGLPFIVMHYVAGPSLQQRVEQSGPPAVAEVLRIGQQAAAGLAAAHAQGLVHRDVKPANILLENGVERVKLTDFGLARAFDDASVTQSGVISGTPQYMAPEQARGEALDHRADLYSLGGVLYFLCAGRPPFRGAAVEVLRKVAEDAPPRLRTLNPDVPDWLEAIVMKLMAKDPAERFQTAAEVADLLGRCLAHVQQPTLAPLPPIPGRQRPAGRPRRWLAVALPVLAGLFVVSEGTGFTQVVQTAVAVLRFKTDDGTLVVEVDDPNVKVTLDDQDLVITGAGAQEVRLKPGRYQLRATRDGQPVQEEIVEITQGGRRVVRVSFEGGGGRAGGVRAGWDPVMPPAVGKTTDRPGFTGKTTDRPRVTGKTFDPIGPNAKARELPSPTAYRVEFRDKPWREVFDWFSKVSGLAFVGSARPVGTFTLVAQAEYTLPMIVDLLNEALIPQKWLLIRRESSFTVVPADERVDPTLVPRIRPEELARRGKTELVSIVMPLKAVAARDVAPEVKKMMGPFGEVIALSAANQLIVQDTAGTLTRIVATVRALDEGPGASRDPGAAPVDTADALDAIRARAAEAEQRALATPVPTGTVVTTPRSEFATGHRAAVVALAAAADGRLLVTTSRDGGIKFWDAPNARLVNEVENSGQSIACAAVSPTGAALASGDRRDGVVTLWDAPSGRRVRALEGHAGRVSAVAFSPDGKQLASGVSVPNGGGGVRIWDVASGKLRSHTEVAWGVTSVTFAPDGLEVVAGTADRLTLRLAADGKITVRHVLPTRVRSVAIDPTGRLLAVAYGESDGHVRLWDRSGSEGLGKDLGGIRAHGREILALAFSPDGKRLLTASSDGTAKLWDVSGGVPRILLTFAPQPAPGPVWAAAFAPDGTTVITVGEDKVVRFWDIHPRAPRQ